MSATMKAAIHLGENYNDNLVTYRNTNFEAVRDLAEIVVCTIEWQFAPWMRFTFLHDKIIKCSKATVHVHSHSFLCLGKMHGHPDAVLKWKDQLQYFQESEENKLFEIVGEPFEFEWNIFPGHTAVQILQEMQVRMTVRKARLEEFEDQINDIDWTMNGKFKEGVRILKW